jgi:hypothetical protein
MAIKLKYGEDDWEIISRNLLSNLKKEKYLSKEITLRFCPETNDKTAIVEFSKTAWIKSQELVKHFSTEVQWRGVTERIGENKFFISDIIIPPQEADAVSVESPEEEFEEWLNSLPDETFYKARSFLHSHVNMPVHPSGTDIKHKRAVIDNFGTPPENADFFCIFLIMNKAGRIDCEIYDISKNLVYETEDVFIVVGLAENETVSSFLKEADKLVRNKPPLFSDGSYFENQAAVLAMRMPQKTKGGKKNGLN